MTVTELPTATTPALRHVLDDIQFVSRYWEDLHDSRLPGTQRSWIQTSSGKASDRRIDDFSAEGKDFGLSVPATPAPTHPDVLDALVDILATAHALSDAVAQLAGVDRLDPPSSAYADPRPYLEHATRWFGQAIEGDGDWLLDSCQDRHDDFSTTRMRSLTATCLRLVLDGHVLPQADCPWCGGRPLKVRLVKDEPLIVCQSNRVCEPPTSDVGWYVKGRPAWIVSEWNWLAQRIRHEDEVVASA